MALMNRGDVQEMMTNLDLSDGVKVSSAMRRLLNHIHAGGPPFHAEEIEPAAAALRELLKQAMENVDDEQLRRVTKLEDLGTVWRAGDEPGPLGFGHERTLAALELKRRSGQLGLNDFVEARRVFHSSLHPILTGMAERLALQALSAEGDEGALEPLLVLAADYRNDESLQSALDRVVSAGDAELFISLLPRLQGTARQRVVAILGRVGDAQASDALVDLLRQAVADEDRKMVDVTAKALERIGLGAVDRLCETLRHDSSSVVRWVAADLLGRIGKAESVEALRSALSDPDEGVRETASVALERINSD